MKNSTLGTKVKHMNNYQIAEEGRADARSEDQPLILVAGYFVCD